jgi:hypothetical protein
MLAHYRDEPGLDVGKLAFPVTFDPDPLDRTSLVKEVFVVYGDVVLRLAGHHAGLAACALIEVYDHPPAFFSHLSRSDGFTPLVVT